MDFRPNGRFFMRLGIRRPKSAVDKQGHATRSKHIRLIFLPKKPRFCAETCVNPQILGPNGGSIKKCHLSEKKPLRTPTPIRKYPLTEAANNAATAKQTETSRRARQVQRAQRSVLFLRSLKLLVSEEICGRFGSFDGSTSVYRLTRTSVR